MPQMRWWNSGGMPAPLSLTRNSPISPWAAQLTSMTRSSRPPCLSALPSKFMKTCSSGTRSVLSTGMSGATRMSTPSRGDSSSVTSRRSRATSTRSSLWRWRPARE